MQSEEFNQLKNHYLNAPDCVFSTYDKHPRQRMKSFYQKVREINRRYRVETPEETQRRMFGVDIEPEV